MDPYIVPFGADGTQFFKTIGEMEAAGDSFADKAEETAQKVKKSFSGAADKQTAQQFSTNLVGGLDLATAGVDKLEAAARRLKLALSRSTDPAIAKSYADQLKQISDRMEAITGKVKTQSGEQVKQIGIIEKLADRAKKYQDAISKATDVNKISALNKELQVTQQEMLQLQNRGKEGFDDIGNALEKTAKSTNVLSKGFGFVRQAAYLIPGIGVAGIFNLIGEEVINLAAKLIQAGDGFDTIKEKVKLITDVQHDANKSAGEQLVNLDALYHTSQNVALAEDERARAAKTLQELFPKTFGNLTTEEILLGKTKDAYKLETEAILANAQAKAAKDKLDEIAAKRLDIAFQKQKIINANAQENANPRAQRVASLNVAGFSVLSDPKEIIAANNARAQAALKEQDILDTRLKNQQGFLVQFAGGENKIAQAVEDANAKKETAQKSEVDKEQKLREEQLKNFTDLSAKFSSQADQLAAKSISDDENSQLGLSDAKFKKIKDDAQRLVDEAKVNNEQRAKLQLQANQIIKEADEANAAEREDIQRKFNDHRLKLEQDAQKALASVATSKQDQEVQKIEERYNELTETIRKGGLLTIDAEKAIEVSRKREIGDVNIKFGSQQIKELTDVQVQSVKLSEQYAGKSVAVEKAKQLAILKVQLDAAERQVKLLQENGKDNESVEVKNALEVVANIKKQISNTQGNNGKGKTLFEALGIGPEAEEKVKMYDHAASEAGKVTADFLNGLADAYNSQVEAQKAKVDQDNQDLEDLQSRLDTEKKLRDEGLANNYDVLQNELQAKKAQRAEDLKNQKEVQDKQNALRKAAIIADSIAQVSNLITAASEIFAAFAEIPFVGVPLAIAAIGLMFGSFAVAKANALNSVGSSQSFGKGGIVDGKPHSQGGKKYYSTDGGSMVEIEGGEYVANKKATQKYETLLDAINNDDLAGMSEDGLRDMLAGMGIGLSAERPKEAIKIVRERNTVRHANSMIETGDQRVGKDVQSIANNVSYLAGRERERVDRWEDDKFRYEKTGSKTVKIEKAK